MHYSPILGNKKIMKYNGKRNRASGVIIHENRVLLMHRINSHEGGREYYTTLGGGVEDDEDIIEAVVREVYEESMVTVKVGELILEHETEGQNQYYYICDYVSGEPGLWVDGPEYAKHQTGDIHEPVWVPFAEIKNINLLPIEIKDVLVDRFGS